MVFDSRRIICAQFKHILSSFYDIVHIWTIDDIVHIWTIDQVLFKICTCKLGEPPKIHLLCGLDILFTYEG